MRGAVAELRGEPAALPVAVHLEGKGNVKDEVKNENDDGAEDDMSRSDSSPSSFKKSKVSPTQEVDEDTKLLLMKLDKHYACLVHACIPYKDFSKVWVPESLSVIGPTQEMFCAVISKVRTVFLYL